MRKYLLLFIAFCFVIPAFGEIYKNNVTVSYYAEDFHGRKTSSGETYNMYDYTCANKELPFNTIIKVTNLSNGKSIKVRVNDRGPFVLNRELDLSKSAAVALGMINTGTTKAKLEIVSLGPDNALSQQTAASALKIMKQRYGDAYSTDSKVTVNTEKPKQSSSESSSGNSVTADSKTSVKTASSSNTAKTITSWDIQCGSFSSKENAKRLAQALLKDGFTNVVYQTTKDSPTVRVVIKNISAEEIAEIEKKLKKNGYNDYLVKIGK